VGWDAVELNQIDWTKISAFGEETYARQARRHRAANYRNAARMYHGLAQALRGQGLAPVASTYRLYEQIMERKALFWSRDIVHWIQSLLLDRVAGYGERPFRTVAIYFSLVALFAAMYFGLTNETLFPIKSDAGQLSYVSSIVLSLTAFHGRGFFFRQTVDLSDPIFILTAIEGVFGLFIEAIFVAAFSRRFLGNQ
jgi:hypothetical protein